MAPHPYPSLPLSETRGDCASHTALGRKTRTVPKLWSPWGSVSPPVQRGAVPRAPGPLPAQPASDTRNHPPKSAVGSEVGTLSYLPGAGKAPGGDDKGLDPGRQRSPQVYSGSGGVRGGMAYYAHSQACCAASPRGGHELPPGS